MVKFNGSFHIYIRIMPPKKTELPSQDKGCCSLVPRAEFQFGSWDLDSLGIERSISVLGAAPSWAFSDSKTKSESETRAFPPKEEAWTAESEQEASWWPSPALRGGFCCLIMESYTARLRLPETFWGLIWDGYDFTGERIILGAIIEGAKFQSKGFNNGRAAQPSRSC